MKRLTFLVLLIVITLAFNALALEVPSNPLGRVSDYTGTLSTSAIRGLDTMLERFEQDTTNQIAVVLIPTLAGDNLEDYSIRLAEKWKIGQKGKDNGVIFLIVKQDRKIRIEVGYGLEGVLPDSLAGEIIRKNIAPHFRRGDFYGGIRVGIFTIMKATSGEYRAPTSRVEFDWNLLIALIAGVLGLGMCLFAMFEGIVSTYLDWKSDKSRGKTNLGFWGYRKSKLIVWGSASYGAGGLGGGGGFGGGFGDGFGGGFSGGGGGFGGGGASGGW